MRRRVATPIERLCRDASVLALVSLFAIPPKLVAGNRIIEYDRTTKNRTGLRASDVCLSCRGDREHHLPRQAIAEWQPTRVEWSYIMDPDFVAYVQAYGANFVGTLSTVLGQGPNQDAEVFDGSRMVAPWMAGFNDGKGVGWACVNKPESLTCRIDRLEQIIKMGINTIQYDDWQCNLSSYNWGGGCFCKYCMAGFAQFLEENADPDTMKAAGVKTWRHFNYHDYLTDQRGWTTTKALMENREKDPLNHYFRSFHITSTRKHFEALIKHAEKISEKPIHLTVNGTMGAGNLSSDFILDKIDYLVGETAIQDHDDFLRIVHMLRMADALNVPQICSPFFGGTINPDPVIVRRAIALAYGMGHRMLIPWDVWPGPKPETFSGEWRWYGTPADYGDLFDFVRAQSHLLDDYGAYADAVIGAPLSSDEATANRVMKQIVALSQELAMAGYPSRYSAYGMVADRIHVPADGRDMQGAVALFTTPDRFLAQEDREAFRRQSRELLTYDASLKLIHEEPFTLNTNLAGWTIVAGQPDLKDNALDSGTAPLEMRTDGSFGPIGRISFDAKSDDPSDFSTYVGQGYGEGLFLQLAGKGNTRTAANVDGQNLGWATMGVASGRWQHVEWTLARDGQLSLEIDGVATFGAQLPGKVSGPIGLYAYKNAQFRNLRVYALPIEPATFLGTLLAPAWQMSDPHVIVYPRIRAKEVSAPCVIHLVRIADAAKPSAGLSLQISSRLTAGAVPAGARLLRPGMDPVDLPIVPNDEGITLGLPPIDPWGMIVFTMTGAQPAR
ncbi:MAG: hypothetical protein O3A51_01920 [Verrucomicrobia bacterium]|nr:hypothetical protein [Verrucomicrobiota bacterium]